MTCPTCPVPAGFTCVAISRGHPRYCELSDPGNPAYLPRIREDVVADSTGRPRRMPVATAPEPPRSEADRAALRARIMEDMAVNACKVRQAVGCGCADRTGLCYRGGLPAVVTREQCKECVRSSAP